eukprot:9412046-Pyramimonas_sp.AAC.1
MSTYMLKWTCETRAMHRLKAVTRALPAYQKHVRIGILTSTASYSPPSIGPCTFGTSVQLNTIPLFKRFAFTNQICVRLFFRFHVVIRIRRSSESDFIRPLSTASCNE